MILAILKVLGTLLLMFAYIHLAAPVFRLAFKSYKTKSAEYLWNGYGPAMLAWPLVLVANLLWRLFIFIGNPFAAFQSIPALKRKFARPGMLARGIPRPSYVLAQMIAARIQQTPEKCIITSRHGWTSWTFTDERFAVEGTNNNIHITRSSDNQQMKIEHDDDKQVIHDARDFADKLNNELAANKAAHDQQLLACSMIEGFFENSVDNLRLQVEKVPLQKFK